MMRSILELIHSCLLCIVDNFLICLKFPFFMIYLMFSKCISRGGSNYNDKVRESTFHLSNLQNILHQVFNTKLYNTQISNIIYIYITRKYLLYKIFRSNFVYMSTNIANFTPLNSSMKNFFASKSSNEKSICSFSVI